MIGKIRIRRAAIVVSIIVFGIVYLFFAHRHLKFMENDFVHRNLNKISDTLTNWLEGQVLGISYEERFCKHLPKWNKSSKYPPVQVIAQQLNIEDGDNVFINGLHCGEWLVALKSTFPNIKLYGVDKDPDSIEYVRRLVNGTYLKSLPFELKRVEFDVQFDHAIIDGILSIYSPELQCQTLTQMVPMLKAGGSLYIGKNFEKCQQENSDIEKYLSQYAHIRMLPQCYWSQLCLNKRSDIVEILYSNENDIMKNNEDENEKLTTIELKKKEILVDFSSCASSVFVHKHIVLHMNDKDIHEKPNSKYQSELHKHKCTWSETANSTNINKIKIDKEGIKKAVIDMQLKGLNIP